MLTQLPALFACETGGKGEELARVGQIHNVSVDAREVRLTYSLDQRVPPIPNSRLEELAGVLQIHPYELSRTHWAVKNVDLYRVLLSEHLDRKTSPKVFDVPLQATPTSNLVSLMMPFDAAFDPVHQVVNQTAEALGLTCKRADDIWQHHAVIQDIVSLIAQSRVVICDCTRKNANVFYEAGIAHTLGRDVVLIAQNSEDIPFDLRHLRYIQYLNNGEGRAALGHQLSARLSTLMRP